MCSPGVWDEEIVPLLRGDLRGKLQATAVLEWLDERHPGRFSASHLRTLQRRMRDWRALHGPDREVYFEQEHPPGREAQMDFTHCGGLGVTVGGEQFDHLLFQFVLSHSGWRYAQICQGETFTALVSGLQGALPSAPVPEYVSYRAKVHKWSTIRVSNRTYSVPSRLIGVTVDVRLYTDHVEVYYKGHLVESMERIKGRREARIDYRHIIGSLVRKPGAFARYRFREQMHPSHTFRLAYDAMRGWKGERADADYVRILHLAATTMECEVERALRRLLASRVKFDYATVRQLSAPASPEIPVVELPGEVDLGVYDRLLAGGAR